MKHIYVIEDDASIAEVISIILEGEGFRVTLDANGDKLFGNKPPKDPIDLVLVDYLLPGTTGAEIVKALSKSTSLSSVPVVMMSANSERELADIAKSLGVSHYLPKPFDVVALIEIVNKALS